MVHCIHLSIRFCWERREWRFVGLPSFLLYEWCQWDTRTPMFPHFYILNLFVPTTFLYLIIISTIISHLPLILLDFLKKLNLVFYLKTQTKSIRLIIYFTKLSRTVLKKIETQLFIQF